MRLTPTPAAQRSAADAPTTRIVGELVRASSATITRTATAAEVVVCPDGKDQPPAAVAQSTRGGRGRRTTVASAKRTSCTPARAATEIAARAHQRRGRPPDSIPAAAARAYAGTPVPVAV